MRALVIESNSSLVSILIGVSALLAAAGCEFGDVAVPIGNTSAAAGAGGASTLPGGAGGASTLPGGAGGATCPESGATVCPVNETLVSERDENGCKVFHCWACPDYSAPACTDEEVLVTGTDADGCPTPTCQACPDSYTGRCADGEVQVLGQDAMGCPMPTCQPCTIYEAPACGDGEIVVVVEDAAGCDVPECVPCPYIEPPVCGEDETPVLGVDADGCPMPDCTPACFSPITYLESGYLDGAGCPCSEDEHDRCIDGQAFYCNGLWELVEDGPCMPQVCNEPATMAPDCAESSWIGYWHNPATGQCEPLVATCPETNDVSQPNVFRSLDECVGFCQDVVTDTAVVPWPSCDGLGIELSGVGTSIPLSREGNVIQIETSWGCGCATRAEFTIAYEPTSPLRLRLCHDEMADSCEAGCSGALSFDLSQAFVEVGTTEFQFID